MVNKIAFLFLTLDNTRFPEIWEYYFKGNENKINIYNHPKNKELVTDSFLKDNIIDDLKETAWGIIVGAILSLLKEALKDKNNKYFILVSESCLPIKPFNEFYNFLNNNHNQKTSYIDFNPKFNVDYKTSIDYLFKKHNFGKYFDRDYKFHKYSHWFCLSRFHIEKIFNNKNIYKQAEIFTHVHTGEELWLSIILPDENIIDYPINYANWDEKYKAGEITNELNNLWNKYDNVDNKKQKYKILNMINKKIKLRKEYGAHPKTYNIINIEDIMEIKNMKSFFLRKFSNDSNIKDYYKILLST